MLFLIIANNSSCVKLELNGGGRKGRKRLISLMLVKNSLTLIWRGFLIFNNQLEMSSSTSVGHILVMNSRMVLLNHAMVTLLLLF